MATNPETAEIGMTVSRSAADERFSRSLHIFVGRGKKHPVNEVAKGTGISASVIYGWLAGPTSQDWRKLHPAHLLTMAGYLGPEFTAELLQPVGQGAFWLPDADDMSPGDLAADLAEDAADVTRRAADGEFCHVDRKALGPRGRRLMVVGAQLAASAA